MGGRRRTHTMDHIARGEMVQLTKTAQQQAGDLLETARLITQIDGLPAIERDMADAAATAAVLASRLATLALLAVERGQ